MEGPLDKGLGRNAIIVAAMAGRGRGVAWVEIEGVDEAVSSRARELLGGNGAV